MWVPQSRRRRTQNEKLVSLSLQIPTQRNLDTMFFGLQPANLPLQCSKMAKPQQAPLLELRELWRQRRQASAGHRGAGQSVPGPACPASPRVAPREAQGQKAWVAWQNAGDVLLAPSDSINGGRTRSNSCRFFSWGSIS